MMVAIKSIELQLLWDKKLPSFECVDQVHKVLLNVPRVCQSSTLGVFFVHRFGEENWFSTDGVMRRSARVGRASSRMDFRDKWHHHRISYVAPLNSG